MEISSTDSPLVAAGALTSVAALDPNAILDAPLLESTFIGDTASVVDFSPLATFLAATVVAQNQKTNQTQQTPTGATTTANFQQLATSTINFVNAFNNFQNSADIFTNPLATAFENALLQEIQTQVEQTGSGNTQSFINNLATLGITFQGADNPINPNQFQINWAMLETAYQTNPTQTAATLSNAFQGLSAIEDNLMLSQFAQNQNIATQLSALDIAEAQSTLQQSTLIEDALLNALDTNLVAPVATTVATPAAASTAAATNPAKVNTDAAEATSTINAQAIMQPLTVDPLVLTAVAAYRAGEVIATAVADRPVKNPAIELNPDIDQVPKVNAINPNANNGTNRDQQNSEHTVARVNKVGFIGETPFPLLPTGINVSV